MLRRMDELGRIALPVQMREQLQLELKDTLEVHVVGQNIVLHRPHKTYKVKPIKKTASCG